MSKKQLLRNALLTLVRMSGGMQAHAEQVSLAAWDFATNVKYTATATDGNKTYYTASSAEKEKIKNRYTAKKPYFNPTTETKTKSTKTI